MVIMPFGTHEVDGCLVDFDMVYHKIFEPAIHAVKTPNGKALVAMRKDQAGFSSSVNQDSFELLMFSKMVIGDISGANANVMYELGARHALQEAGTLLLRQVGHTIPYSIRTVKVFEYDPAEIEESKDFITEVITKTLERARIDSPIRIAGTNRSAIRG